MTARALCALWCVAALASCCPSAQPDPGAPPPRALTQADLQTDLDALKRLMVVPPEVARARFFVQPLGNPGGLAPGPTDYRAVAFLYVSPSQRAALRARLGAHAAPEIWSAPADEAALLLGEDVAPSPADAQGLIHLSAAPLPPEPFASGLTWRASYAFLLEPGLLVGLHTQ